MFKLVVEFSVKMLIIEYHLDISFRILLNESMKVYSIFFLVVLYKKNVYNSACFNSVFQQRYYAISNLTTMGPAMAYVMGDAK